MSDDKESNARFGARLLIIFYALGIVVLGAYPLRKQYGGVWQSIKAEYRSIVAFRPDTSGFRARLNPPPTRKVRVDARSKAAGNAAQDKDLDGLTKNDRAELNNLIDTLNP